MTTKSQTTEISGKLRFKPFFLLISLLLLGGGFAIAPTFAEEMEKKDCSGCLWGKLGEKTTYLPAYCPLEGPEIPLIPSKEENEKRAKLYPMSPEEALTIVMADGCQYRFYYQEETRMRPVSEFRQVFEPIEWEETREVEGINPITGCPEIYHVTETVRSPFPVLHEKEFIHYEPVKVLVRVIIPAGPDKEGATGYQNGGSAGVRLPTDYSL